MYLKFSQATFDRLDLPDLFINMWDYAHYTNCPCKRYYYFCAEAAAKKWLPRYLRYDYVTRQIKMQNRCFIDFGKISTERKNTIYALIERDY